MPTVLYAFSFHFDQREDIELFEQPSKTARKPDIISAADSWSSALCETC